MHWAHRMLDVCACLLARRNAPASAPARLPACLPALPTRYTYLQQGVCGAQWHHAVNIYATGTTVSQGICALALPSQLYALFALVQPAAAAGLVHQNLHSGDALSGRPRRHRQARGWPPPHQRIPWAGKGRRAAAASVACKPHQRILRPPGMPGISAVAKVAAAAPMHTWRAWEGGSPSSAEVNKSQKR